MVLVKTPARRRSQAWTLSTSPIAVREDAEDLHRSCPRCSAVEIIAPSARTLRLLKI
jgi:hypothetical protein